MATGTVGQSARLFHTESAFQWAFLAGVLMIVAVKLIAQGAPIGGGIFAAALGILVMWRYKSDQVHARPEREKPRLGDEVYYLGLLYTLTSLCAALITLFLLDRAEAIDQRTDEMIGSFGIALLTTMAGIFMRMPLQRHVPEGQATETIIRIPAEVQGVTVELDRYAHELRRQLESSASAFAYHANKTILQAKTTHAHMDELMQTFHGGLEEKASAELARLEALHKSVLDNAEEAQKQAAAHQEGMQTAQQRLREQVTAMDQSMERIRVGSEETTENLQTLGERTLENAQAMERSMVLHRQTTEALQGMQHAIQVLPQLGQETQGARDELGRLLKSFAKANTALEHLAEVSSAGTAVLDMESTASALSLQLTGIAAAGKRHQEALDETVAKLQALAETAGRGLKEHQELKDTLSDFAEALRGLTETLQKVRPGSRRFPFLGR